jgi:hypothetical protein
VCTAVHFYSFLLIVYVAPLLYAARLPKGLLCSFWCMAEGGGL